MDFNIDECFKNLMSVEGANGFVIFNAEGKYINFNFRIKISIVGFSIFCSYLWFFLGIPIRRHDKTITNDRAIHMAALFSDLWNVSRRIIKEELKSGFDVKNI